MLSAKTDGQARVIAGKLMLGQKMMFFCKAASAGDDMRRRIQDLLTAYVPDRTANLMTKFKVVTLEPKRERSSAS
jgi:hypothetical protein